jgi:hypothetical protein
MVGVEVDLRKESTVKVITKYSIEVEKKDIYARLVKNFIETIASYADAELQDLSLQVNSFSDVLETIEEGNWSKVFSMGYTTMLLDQPTMEAVERFFHQKKTNEMARDTELEIVVVDADWKYFIREIDIDY